MQDERNWIDAILAAGYVDTFRTASPKQEGAFTCWPYSRNSRERNIGWRLDYIFVEENIGIKTCFMVGILVWK